LLNTSILNSIQYFHTPQSVLTSSLIFCHWYISIILLLFW